MHFNYLLFSLVQIRSSMIFENSNRINCASIYRGFLCIFHLLLFSVLLKWDQFVRRWWSGKSNHLLFHELRDAMVELLRFIANESQLCTIVRNLRRIFVGIWPLAEQHPAPVASEVATRQFKVLREPVFVEIFVSAISSGHLDHSQVSFKYFYLQHPNLNSLIKTFAVE